MYRQFIGFYCILLIIIIISRCLGTLHYSTPSLEQTLYSSRPEFHMTNRSASNSYDVLYHMILRPYQFDYGMWILNFCLRCGLQSQLVASIAESQTEYVNIQSQHVHKLPPREGELFMWLEIILFISSCGAIYWIFSFVNDVHCEDCK